jgi:hypothetical protein
LIFWLFGFEQSGKNLPSGKEAKNYFILMNCFETVPFLDALKKYKSLMPTHI